jgi:SAM-dependent methyltransferase
MFKALQNQNQIDAAREDMKSKGRSVLESGFLKALRRTGLLGGLPVGDKVKSWDVAQTLEFIDTHAPREAKILDLGAYCSEVPVALVKMGYRNVSGVDLNTEIKKMPYADKVAYTVSDFMKMPFPSNSYDVVTAISVIEHGYEPERLFAELGRVIRPGGYFICSFDYWPEKIDTINTKFFDLTWLIFSTGDVDSLLDVAKLNGFSPLGEVHHEADEPLINCMGFNYTFGWLVLKKDI